MTPTTPLEAARLEARGDELRKAGTLADAAAAYASAAECVEVPPASLCAKLARAHERLGDPTLACRWARAVVDAADDFSAWQAAAAVLLRARDGDREPRTRRSARVTLTGSYTTTQLAPLLTLAAARLGLALDVRESAYGQYRQEILDPTSALHAHAPDVVVLAVHEGEVALPAHSDAPEAAVEEELSRWTSLWSAVARHARARVVQHTFAIPPETPMGHLGARLAGSRYAMTQALNLRLAAAAGDGVSVVDCERLAGTLGKARWFDARYWHLSKQAVALDAVPLLARHTAAVIAADLGLSRKCLVLDLDNTLWGGVVGEDGVEGLRLGGGVEGEAFVAFQDYVLALKRKGVVLAVVSKNDDADARAPFRRHPEMRLRLDDIAVFAASWEGKVGSIRAVAETLDLGLDALVFVDDNPVERAAVRRFLPEVDVIALPADPCGYVRALAEYTGFETSSFTGDDARRTAQYRARAQVAELQASAGSLEEFHRSLRMQASVTPFAEMDLPRIAQLVAKTNQFNLTGRRHGLAALRAFAADPRCVHLALRLRDRFDDHGLVSVLIAIAEGEALDIDTWLMSCRVIGRTVEAEMLAQASRRALELGCTRLRGTYVPTAKNAMVGDLYPRLGFAPAGERDGTTFWTYDLTARGPVENGFIEVADALELAR